MVQKEPRDRSLGSKSISGMGPPCERTTIARVICAWRAAYQKLYSLKSAHHLIPSLHLRFLSAPALWRSKIWQIRKIEALDTFGPVLHLSCIYFIDLEKWEMSIIKDSNNAGKWKKATNLLNSLYPEITSELHYRYNLLILWRQKAMSKRETECNWKKGKETDGWDRSEGICLRCHSWLWPWSPWDSIPC